MTLVDNALDLLNAYDFTPVFACEDGRHKRGIAFHTSDAPAEYRMVAPCCGTRALVCRTRAEYLMGPTCATIRCTTRDIKHDSKAYGFYPIEAS